MVPYSSNNNWTINDIKNHTITYLKKEDKKSLLDLITYVKEHTTSLLLRKEFDDLVKKYFKLLKKF